MANQRFLLLVFVFMAMINTGLMTEPAYTASCDAIVGKWAWFTKGVVTLILMARWSMNRVTTAHGNVTMRRGEGLRFGGDWEGM